LIENIYLVASSVPKGSFICAKRHQINRYKLKQLGEISITESFQNRLGIKIAVQTQIGVVGVTFPVMILETG